MSDTTFTFRVDHGLKAEFIKSARAHDRSAGQLLRDFMRDFVHQERQSEAYDTWFREQVQAGLDSANAGDLFSTEAVEAQMAARRAKTLRRLDRGQK
jgi:predicted transcriptional regulator